MRCSKWKICAIGVPVVMALTACASENGNQADMGGGQDSGSDPGIGGSSQGGAAATSATSGGGAEATNATTNTSSAGGSGAQGGTVTLRPASCDESQALLSGTLEGADVDLDWETSRSLGSFADSGFSWAIDVSKEPTSVELGGTLMMVGAEELEQQNPLWFALEHAQTARLTWGMLWMPGGLEQPIHCIGPGSTATRVEEEAQLELTSMDLLGTCPGTPVEGEIQFCNSQALVGCGDLSFGELGGSVDGISVPSGTRYDYLGNAVERYELNFPYGYIHFEDALDGSSINGGVIFTAPDSPFAGAVYCVGEGSGYDILDPNDPSDERLYSFRNLSTLGSCVGASGSDALSGCIR